MAAEPVSHVWAALVQGEGDGADVGAPTMLFCPPHYPHFNVDALKYAAKAQFVQLPANVAAAQLSVSATREGPRVERPSALVQSLGGSSDEQPLYIHAPAPSQGRYRGRFLAFVFLLASFYVFSEHFTNDTPFKGAVRAYCMLYACWSIPAVQDLIWSIPQVQGLIRSINPAQLAVRGFIHAWLERYRGLGRSEEEEPLTSRASS